MIPTGAVVRVCAPRSFAGVTEYPSEWSNRVGTVTAGGRRFVSLVLEGELDELGFFADELVILKSI